MIMEKGTVVTTKENEAYLRQVSQPVELDDKDLEADIQILEEYCKANEVMAMAAVQLGIAKRFVYLKNTRLDIIRKIQRSENSDEEANYNEARVLINPVIIKKEGLTDYWEACASCGNYIGHVYRPYRIVVEYFGIDGEQHCDIFEGFESTVLSHEMDHLDGILHMDVATEVLEKTPEERKLWRQTHDYHVYSQDGDTLELMKKEVPVMIKK